MKNGADTVNHWSEQVRILAKMDQLYHAILQTETTHPNEALSKAYGIFTDEQKMAFILAGGAPSLFRYQEQRIHRMRTRRGSSDTQTGQLPVLC